MNLLELISAHGIDGIVFQNLDQCLDKAVWNGKSRITTITFGTQELLTLMGTTERQGIVVWLDRAKCDAIITKVKEEAEKKS